MCGFIGGRSVHRHERAGPSPPEWTWPGLSVAPPAGAPASLHAAALHPLPAQGRGYRGRVAVAGPVVPGALRQGAGGVRCDYGLATRPSRWCHLLFTLPETLPHRLLPGASPDRRGGPRTGRIRVPLHHCTHPATLLMRERVEKRPRPVSPPPAARPRRAPEGAMSARGQKTLGGHPYVNEYAKGIAFASFRVRPDR